MIKYFKNASEKMMLDFKESSSINHTGVKGKAREKTILKEFLKPYLPLRYSLSSGIIIDKNNLQSRQQDIIIYDNFCSPVLKDLDDEKLFFPESVLVSLEVKSTLDKAALEDCQLKAESIYSLAYSSSPTISLTSNFVLDAAKPPIFCAAFAYECSKTLENIRDDWREIKKKSDHPNALSLLCILKDRDDKPGIILHVNGSDLNEIILIPNNNSRLALLKNQNQGETLLHFYLFLMQYLSSIGLFIPSPDMFKYVESAGVSENNFSISREDLEGASVIQDGEKVELDDAFLMSKLVQKNFDGGLDDNEAMDFILTMSRLPKMQYIQSSSTRFYEVHPTHNNLTRPLDIPPPADIIKSVIAIKNNTASEEDQNNFKMWKNIIDRVGKKEMTIEIR